MLLQDLLTEQIVAFHTAIMDSCHRSLRPEQTDRMALSLRRNAVSMAKLQLAMASLAGSEAPSPEPARAPSPEPARAPSPEPARASVPDGAAPEHAAPGQAALNHAAPEYVAPNHAAPGPSLPLPASPEPPRPPPPAPCRAEPADHVLSGDALSLFVSHRLAPGESAHEAWEWALAAGEDATQRYPTRASDCRRRDVNARPP